MTTFVSPPETKVPQPANSSNQSEVSSGDFDGSRRSPSGARVAFYIDADNQSAMSVNDLVEVFGAHSIRYAAIAGNNHGSKIESWSSALRARCPGIVLRTRLVASRREAADIALILELGANLQQHQRDRECIVIVSRDELLINTAEQIMETGCPVMVAYGYCDNPPPRQTRLVTLLLPGTHKPPPVPAPKPNSQKSPLAVASTHSSSAQPTQIAELTQLRNLLSPKPGGGYGATEVGQALSKLGYKSKSERAKFLKSVPGLTERGTGPNKVLVF